MRGLSGLAPEGAGEGKGRMTTGGNREIVERYMRAIPTDFAALEALHHPDFVQEFPQSGERFRGHAKFRAAHERYVGVESRTRRIVGEEDKWVLTPTFAPLRITGTGDAYTVEADGSYPDGSFYKVVVILELRDGKVRKATTYFAPPFEAPEW